MFHVRGCYLRRTLWVFDLSQTKDRSFWSYIWYAERLSHGLVRGLDVRSIDHNWRALVIVIWISCLAAAWCYIERQRDRKVVMFVPRVSRCFNIGARPLSHNSFINGRYRIIGDVIEAVSWRDPLVCSYYASTLLEQLSSILFLGRDFI